MPELPRTLAHIYVERTGHPEAYVSKARGNTPSPPARERDAHANSLLQSLNNALRQIGTGLHAERAADDRGPAGFVLEFQLPLGSEKFVEKLEDRRQGIELLSVTDRGENVLRASVYVPMRAQGYFLRKIERYRHEETKGGRPKNEPLISRLDTISLGAFSSVYTDDLDSLPPADTPVWWEVWLRSGQREAFEGSARRLELRLGAERLIFPEREVVLAFGLEASIGRCVVESGAIAEVRRAKDAPSLFLALQNDEQADWADDIAGRVMPPREDAVAVCEANLEHFTVSERYILNAEDKTLLSAATTLLMKVAAAETTKPAQSVTVAKLLHVLSALPQVTPDLTASLSVCSPRRKFSEIETFHWWDFEIEDGRLLISSGGHIYDPKTGGDTFTNMDWCAIPEEPTEQNDYRGSLWMVPDVLSFPGGVESIDLAGGGYTVRVLDEDNPLLDGLDGENINEEDSKAKNDIVVDEDDPTANEEAVADAPTAPGVKFEYGGFDFDKFETAQQAVTGASAGKSTEDMAKASRLESSYEAVTRKPVFSKARTGIGLRTVGRFGLGLLLIGGVVTGVGAWLYHAHQLELREADAKAAEEEHARSITVGLGKTWDARDDWEKGMSSSVGETGTFYTVEVEKALNRGSAGFSLWNDRRCKEVRRDGEFGAIDPNPDEYKRTRFTTFASIFARSHKRDNGIQRAKRRDLHFGGEDR